MTADQVAQAVIEVLGIGYGAGLGFGVLVLLFSTRGGR